MCVHTFFIIRIYLIRIQRLTFRENILGFSANIHFTMYLTVEKESFHPEMQFKTVFVGGRCRIFEKNDVEVKNICASDEKKHHSYEEKEK